MNFDGFYGNERAKEYLSAAFARKTFPHALLIAGESGIGKKTLADIIARALVCENSAPPCGACSACYKSQKGIHPDIIYLGGDSSSVKVNDIRNLKRDALLRPNDAERKVYIINNAGAMTHDAQDAFLKILEEPPLFTFFILLCYNYSDLLSTIVSRTAHITLSPLSDDDMRKVIAAKIPDASAQYTEELIRTSGGICSFLVEEKNSSALDSASDIIRALISRDEFNIFKAFLPLEKCERDSLLSVMDELIIIIRDAIVLSSDAKSRIISQADASLASQFSQIYTPKLCCDIIDYISDARNSCIRNVGVSHIIGALTCNFAYSAAVAASKG